MQSVNTAKNNKISAERNKRRNTDEARHKDTKNRNVTLGKINQDSCNTNRLNIQVYLARALPKSQIGRDLKTNNKNLERLFFFF